MGSDMLEGLETTDRTFGQMSASSPATPSLREELNPADLELEPMAERRADSSGSHGRRGERLGDADLVLEGNIEAPPKAPAPAPRKSAASPPPAVRVRGCPS